MADIQHNGSAPMRADQTDNMSSLPALDPGAGAASPAAPPLQVTHHAKPVCPQRSLISAVLAGAEPRPSDDQPDYELELLPSAVDANLARANGHLDYRRKTGRREDLISQLQNSMRLARQLGQLMFVLRARDASVKDQEEVATNVFACTFHAGFLAGTDAAEASYLRRTVPTALQSLQVSSPSLRSQGADRGSCIDLPTLDALFEANDASLLNFNEVVFLARTLGTSSEFQSLWEQTGSALIDAGWQVPPQCEPDTWRTSTEDFDLTAARLVRVGYMAARSQLVKETAAPSRLEELADLFRYKVDMGAVHDEDLTLRGYWRSEDVAAARRIVRLERDPEEWASFYSLVDQGMEEQAAWDKLEETQKDGRR